MREVVLTVPRRAVEDVLDRLLPIAAGGVREVPAGRRVQLLIRGDAIPRREELVRAAGRWSHSLLEREIPDDWRERRVHDYRADAIGGRLVVRPDWAPPPGGDVIDIVLAGLDAFGAGTHPTTRMCLELLLGISPIGSFVELGCGTGVQAILAAYLGWSPVIAVDVAPESVRAAEANAEANGVTVETRLLDLFDQAPPGADGFAANVASSLHAVIADNLPDPPPSLGLISGFAPGEAPPLIAAYGTRGLREHQSVIAHGWCALVLKRD